MINTFTPNALYLPKRFADDKYDVNKIASIFGGGGHIKAAGFKTDLSFEEILEKTYKELEK